MPLDWSMLWLSLRYAGLATLFSMLAALPLARLLAHRRFPGYELLDAAATLPLVLPPAVLIYYLLAALGSWPLRFSWHTAVAVSAIYTLPLLLRSMRASLESVDTGFENAARGLGSGEWRTFRLVTVPLALRALLADVLMVFVRAFADFGATAIVAGGIVNGGLFLPIAAIALGALYLRNRLRHARVPA